MFQEELAVDIKKKIMRLCFEVYFRQPKRWKHVEKCLQNNVNEKHLSGNTTFFNMLKRFQ